MNITWTERLASTVTQLNPKDYWPKYWIATNENGKFLTAITPDSNNQWNVSVSPNKKERFQSIEDAKQRAEEWLRNSL